MPQGIEKPAGIMLGMKARSRTSRIIKVHSLWLSGGAFASGARGDILFILQVDGDEVLQMPFVFFYRLRWAATNKTGESSVLLQLRRKNGRSH